MIDQNILANGKAVQLMLAKEGKFLRELCHSRYEDVRVEVAKRKYNLEFLANDESDKVKLEVIKSGYTTEKFAYSNKKKILLELAKQGKYLDLLINLDDEDVLFEIAKHGYKLREVFDKGYHKICEYILSKGYFVEEFEDTDDLDYLIAITSSGYKPEKYEDHESYLVRRAVASTGYNTEKFKNDESQYVISMLAANGYCLEELSTNKNDFIRITVAGYCYKILNENKNISNVEKRRLENILFQFHFDNQTRIIEYALKYHFSMDRYIVKKIEERYGSQEVVEENILEKFADHWSDVIKLQIARRGLYLEKFYNSNNTEILSNVIKFTKDKSKLEFLADSDNFLIRGECARHGICLDKLKNDEDSHVRQCVINSPYVTDEILNYLFENGTEKDHEALAKINFRVEDLIEHPKSLIVLNNIAKNYYDVDELPTGCIGKLLILKTDKADIYVKDFEELVKYGDREYIGYLFKNVEKTKAKFALNQLIDYYENIGAPLKSEEIRNKVDLDDGFEFKSDEC